MFSPERVELEEVLARSPVLATAYRQGGEFPTALTRLLALPAKRPSQAWVAPPGSARSIFASLARHRLALYAVPDFLWNGLFAPARHAAFFTPLIEAVAAGESLADYVRTGHFPVVLNRAQCHAFLQTSPSLPFLEGLRRAQAMRLPAPVTVELLGTEWGRELFLLEIERAWSHWIEWISHHPAVPAHAVSPLSDFAVARLPAGYSLKGRTVDSLRSAMEAWHEELAKGELRPPIVECQSNFRSGFIGAEWTTEQDGFVERWSVAEIETLEALLQEGRRLRHCVFSYLTRIRSGRSSIWSLAVRRPEGRQRLVTVEVRNGEREIVQVRGACNRRPSADEMRAIERWATSAGLTISGSVRY